MNHRAGLSCMRRSLLWTGFVLLVWATTPATAENAEAVLHRIFLTGGDNVVSYGEYARVGDRVIFSIPLGVGSGATTQLVSIPTAAVDWPRTERYTESREGRTLRGHPRGVGFQRAEHGDRAGLEPDRERARRRAEAADRRAGTRDPRELDEGPLRVPRR